MAMVRWSPMYDRQRMLNRMFDEFFGRQEEDAEVVQQVWMPRMDIVEDKNEYRVVADLPGMKKEDVSITLEDGVLEISGERVEEEKREDESVHARERAYGRFRRRFTVRENIDTEKISAAFKEGVLTVHLPKAEAAKPRKIEIKAA